MKRCDSISVPMPDLSPEAAYALSDWLSILAHEVDLHYGDHIRSHMEKLDREQVEIEQEIISLRNNYNDQQQELLF